MRFDSYPFDSHICYLKILSWSKNEESLKIEFRWHILEKHWENINPINDFPSSKLDFSESSQVALLDYEVLVEKLPESVRREYFEGGGYFINGGFKMRLKRKTNKYIWNYFIPSGILVSISWVRKICDVNYWGVIKKSILQISFLIPPEVVPGRMGLLITLMLVLVNLFINITSKSPNTDSMTAISSWMIACISFVSLALIEYAMVLLFKHITSFNFSPTFGKRMLGYVDSFSMLVSISFFTIFNLTFWSVRL